MEDLIRGHGLGVSCVFYKWEASPRPDLENQSTLPFRVENQSYSSSSPLGLYHKNCQRAKRKKWYFKVIFVAKVTIIYFMSLTMFVTDQPIYLFSIIIALRKRIISIHQRVIEEFALYSIAQF